MHIFKRFLTILLAVALVGCGSSGSVNSSGGSSSGDSSTMHFELSTGILDYDGYEYVSKGFYSDASGDVSKTIVLNFNYTNKENTPKSYSKDFWIRAYQNGTELNGPSGYTSDGQTEAMKNKSATVLQNGVIKIGIAVVLQDDSPVTVIANHNGGKEVSNNHIVNVEPYQDNSFDINRLYGYWEGKNSTALTLTTAKVTLQRSKSSSTYTESPRIWTDETTLHTNLSDIDSLTIEERDGALYLSNAEYEFKQIENWPESGVAAELQEIGIGETISVEFADIAFTKNGSTDELKYSSTSGGGGGGYGGHITMSTILGQKKSGTEYLYLEGTIKNTSSTEYDPTDMKVKAVVNGTYELEGDVHVVDGGQSQNSINPLNTMILVLHTGVDSSTAKNISSLEWYIGFERSFSGSDDGDPEGSSYYYMIKVK